MSKIVFLHVNWQRNVDGTQEAELRSAEVQRPVSRRRAHNKKHGMCRECLYSQTTHGWNVWGICSRWAAREQRGDRCWLLAVSCWLLAVSFWLWRWVRSVQVNLRHLWLTMGYFCHSAVCSNGYLAPSFPAAYLVIKLNQSRSENCTLSSPHGMLKSIPNSVWGQSAVAKCETSRSTCDTNTCINRRPAAAVLLYYMYAATGTLFFSFWFFAKLDVC